MYKKCRSELVDKPKYHPYRKFTRNDLTEKLVKNLKTPNINALRRGLKFNVIDAFNRKQQSIT